MSISQKNNTRALRKEITKKLNSSKMWLVVRQDKDGIHLHMPNEEHMVLLVLLLEGHPELYESIKETIEEHK